MPLYACGSNASSQLALGHAADEYTLTPTVFDSSVPPGHVVDLVSASTHALALYALREGGTILLGAGTNTCGQLGGRCALWDAQPQARWKAVDLRTPEMKGEDGWEPSQIAAAWTTSYVIYQRHLEGPAGEEAGQGATSIASAPATRREQALISAGSNDFAELGHGAAYASPPTAHPRRVALDLGEGEEATLLRAVQRHAVVVLRGLKGDRLIGWGASRRGELDPKSAVPSATLPGKGKGKGKAPARPSVSGPIEVLSPAQRIRDVRLGAAHTVVLFEDGTVRAWGADVKGQIRGLDGLRGVRAIAATWNGTYGLDEDGVWAQGSNTHGQLLSADPGGGGGGAGEGGNADRQRVVLPPAFDVTGIVAGTEHVVLCGSVNGENALYTGGWNEHGNLGVGDTEERLGLSNTPVPYQCSICRKVGGYMGSINIMGNTSTLDIIRGKDKIKVYIAPVEFDHDDKPKKMGNSKRSFCTECSSMLWNYHDEWPDWIYPFASTIDAPNPLPPIPEGTTAYTLKRASCPEHVPVPAGWKTYQGYGPGKGIEEWHKINGAWVD